MSSRGLIGDRAEGEGGDDGVETSAFERHRFAEHLLLDDAPVTQPRSRQLDHGFARVDRHDLRAPLDELFGVEARATTGVEHTLAADVTEQLQERRPVVVRVVRPIGRVPLEHRGHRVVHASQMIVHPRDSMNPLPARSPSAFAGWHVALGRAAATASQLS